MQVQKSRLQPLPIKPSPIAPTKPSDRADVDIYRPFFIAGIISVLTAGCMLGAIALLGVALNKSYTISAWAPYILAHANSQLYGWVGFFIMGFALQQHAPTVAKERIFHRLAYASMILMSVGIALRFVAEPMSVVDNGTWVPVGVFSTLLQLVAVVLFLYNSGANRHRSGAGLTWQTTFVFSSLGWLFIVAALEPIVFAFSHQFDKQASVMFVAQWFYPLREMQFLGFVAMMIFGVALVKFGSCLGFRKADPVFGMIGYAGWMSGLILRLFGWVHFFNSNLTEGADQMMRIGSVLMVVGTIAIVISLGLFETVVEALRPQKFLRAAFSWLLISGGLMLLEPMHLQAIGAPFSHAFTGAIRHAVTVGFISQMIIGVSLHVASRINGIQDQNSPALWSVFWLLNVGNCARVALEIGTDYSVASFMPMGLTGFIELTGLAIWGFTMMRILVAKFNLRFQHEVKSAIRSS